MEPVIYRQHKKLLFYAKKRILSNSFYHFAIEVDNFKKYNDQYGHLTGDSILRNIGTILKSNAREVDIVCRYGGEEFMMILPETDAAGATAIADKIRETISSCNQREESLVNVGPITVSGGIAQYEKKFGKEQFIQYTDQALYQAKKEGKNKICVWQP